MQGQATESPSFLTDGGDTGALMRAHDWSQSPLGLPGTWSQSLRAIVGMMLNSKFPMFIAWGADLIFLYNDSYAEVLGAKHPDALGGRFKDIWLEIWDDIHPIIAQAMKGQASFHKDLPLTMHRKGYEEKTWFTFSYSPVRDESGDVAGMFCACTETTDQVLAEQHRIKEIERLRQLFQQAPGIIAVMREPQHVFEIVNDAYLQLIGHREVTGKPVREALPELAGQGFFELLDQVYTTGEPYLGHEVPVTLRRRHDGELEKRFVNFVYQPIRDHRGNVYGIFVEGSDVTEAVHANAALRESELRLRQLANTIPQLAWMANADGWTHWYNDRWYDYTGATLEEMEGWGWQRIHDPERLPAVMEVWNASIATGKPFELTIPLRGANGEYRTFFTSAAPLRDAAGNIVQWFGTNTDVTPIEQAQKELLAANKRKDEFLAMLAHELRNPLAPISTAAELLKLAALDENRVRQTSNVIARQVAHMTALIDDLLDVSRVTRGQVTLRKETLSVNGLVADAIEQVHSLLEAKHHRLTVEAPQEQLFVTGDRTRLIQVMANLLNNAVRYTPANGNIALRVMADNAEVAIVVQDDGMGIAPDLLPHVFELFTQAERSPDRSQGGLGLGLALVKSLVGLHDGRVSVHSNGNGRGSRFEIRLPLSAAPAGSQTQQIAKAVDSPGEKREHLLVVDDNQDAARTLAMLLEAVGHSVSVSFDAREALACAQEKSPALLFLDIGLPDMDGYELARRLRALPATENAMLVAVTGYGQAEDKERARQAGFDHHLVKPVTLNAVLGMLERLLPRSGGAV